MPAEQHVILRQVVEITVPSEDAGRRVHDTVSRLCRTRLSPILERECSALSAPDTLHRLDRVEIDLGHLSSDGWETALSERFERECGPSLSRAFHATAAGAGGGQATQIRSRFELLEHFLQNGVLPWWADASNPAPMADALQWLAREAPPQLAAWARRITRQPSALRRLVRAISDDDLRTLLASLRPQDFGILHRLTLALSQPPGSQPGASGRRPDALRHEAWQSVLQAAHDTGADLAAVVRRAVSLMSAACRMTERELLAELAARHEFRGTPGGDESQERLEGLLAGPADRGPSPAQEPRQAPEQPEASTTPWAVFLAAIRPHVEPRTYAMLADSAALREFPNPPVEDMLSNRLRRLLAGPADHGPSPAQEPPQAPEQPGASTMPWAVFLAGIRPLIEPRTYAMLADSAALREFPNTPVEDKLSDCLRRLLAGPADRLPALLPDLARVIERLGPSATASDLLVAIQAPGGPLADALPTGAGLREVSRDAETSEVEANELPVESGFSETDALYVENAGLVLLWPFLDHFFAHLGLLEEKQFKTEEARHRAVGLLQCLAAADRTPAEYRLPLNKVLCGMNLDEVFDFGTPVTDDEFAECDHLLTAVIEQAAILKQMSTDGFRGSFLLRQGQLTARDGGWLLRVKRESYDVVRDRFPWPVQWLRLPWMKATMQVEW